MNGAEKAQQLEAAGFSPDDVRGWAEGERARLASAGFNEAEVGAWFGEREPNLTPVREQLRKNFLAAGATDETATAGGIMGEKGLEQASAIEQAAVKPEFTPAQRLMIDRGDTATKISGGKPARTFDDALTAGLQISVSGLLARGKEPDRVLTEDAPMASRIAANIGTIIGDLPWMTLGAVAGGAGGAPGGPLAVPTAMAGAFALPSALRATLTDAYRNGDFKSFGDFWERSSGIIWEEAKGWMTGFATAGAGAVASRAVAGSAAAARAMAPTAAEVATMVTVGKALEGQVPAAQDFLDAAVILGGAKGAHVIAKKLQDVYARTGAAPRDVMDLAARDPTVLQDIVAENRPEPEAFEVAPEDPNYRPSLADPAYRRELALMRDETGWAEVGGRMIRQYDAGGEAPEVVGRTKWIPNAPWWQDRPQGLTEAGAKAAVDKALAGKPLGRAEQRMVDYMLGWARDNVVEPTRQMDEAERAAVANELAAQALDATPRNMREVDLVAKAVEYDEAAVERAAVAHADDHPAFMAEIRAIHDRFDQAAAGAGSADADAGGEAGGSRKGRGQTPRERERERAALQAEGSVRELNDAELAGAHGGNAAAPPMRPPAGARPAESPEPTPSQQAVLDRVSAGEGSRRAYTADKFYADMKDELFPIRRLVDAIREDETLTASKDPYKLARLTRGLAGKAQQFLEISPFKFDTYENVGKAFTKIIEPVKDDLDGLRSYLVAKRALELDRRDIETGVPLDAARDVVRTGGKYENVQKDLLEYQDHLVRYLVDAGVLSKDGAKAMRDANRDYVPFFRLMDDESGGPKGAGPGLSVRSPVKAIKGSERRIVDPLESIVKNTYLYTTLAERNAVHTALVDLAEEAGREDLVKKVASPAKPVDVQAKEVEAFLAAHGLDKEAAEAFTIFRRGYVQPAENEIVVYQDGKRAIYEIPVEAARAYKALDREAAGLLTRIMAIPARTLRAGATLAPDFMLRNFFRDQLSAYSFSQNGYVPVLDFLRGLAGVARKDDDFQMWLKSGGANATLMSMDRRYLQAKLDEIAELQSVGQKAWNVVKTPVELLRITSELVENATRLGEFKRGGGAASKEAAQEAGFSSREVTLDFARMGAKTRGMNMITAFWNAQVEGVDRAVRAFRDDPLVTTAKIGASITLPSILLWWANHDDPRWKEIPDWERDMFWIVLTKEHIYRIPKPFELGVMFGSVPERLLDAFVDAKPDAGKGLMKSVAQAFLPGIIPTVAAPILEQVTNHSFFTDRPLVPSNLEKLLPEYQYSPYTTEATKALGHMIGTVPGMHDSAAASPQVIDNYIRGWSGTLGVYAIQVADAALRKSGVLPDPVKPTATLADVPVIKAFVVRYPSAQAQSIADFNDHYKESKMVIDTVQYLAKQGEPAAAMREANLDPVKLIRLDSIHEGLANAHRVIQLIEKNPNFAADEKRQLIDTTYTQMIDMAREGEGMLREIKRELEPKFGRASKGAADVAAVH